MKDQSRSPKPPRSINFCWLAIVCMALQNVTFSKSQKIAFRIVFRVILGAQNRPKSVPKRGPKRKPIPASFFDWFYVDFGSLFRWIFDVFSFAFEGLSTRFLQLFRNARSSRNTVKRISKPIFSRLQLSGACVAKRFEIAEKQWRNVLSFLVPSGVEKSSIFGSILEAETVRQSMKTEVRKRIEISVPSGSVFRRFWSRFGVPRPSQKSWKIGLASYLRRKPELDKLQGANVNVFGVIRERF